MKAKAKAGGGNALTLKEAIEKSVKDTAFREVLLALLLPQEDWMAIRIHQAIKTTGLSILTGGVDEAMLCRCLAAVPRELGPEIAKAYDAMYGEDIVHAIEKACSGDFEKGCVRLAQALSPGELTAPSAVVDLDTV